jgi:hypothetical protein
VFALESISRTSGDIGHNLPGLLFVGRVVLILLSQNSTLTQRIEYNYAVGTKMFF